MSPQALRTPVNVTLRRFARGSDPVSANWNVSLVGGQGAWQSDGCHILGHHDNFTTISCNSLGNYGLLMVRPSTGPFLLGVVCSLGEQHYNFLYKELKGLKLHLCCRTSAVWSSSLPVSSPFTQSSTPPLFSSSSVCSPLLSVTSITTGNYLCFC